MGRAATLGGDDRRLERSSLLGGLGDGMVATTLPLLAAGVTRHPLAVAAVVAAQHAPWAGVAVLGADLLGDGDRRTVLGAAATLRAVTAGLLGIAAVGGGDTLVVLVAAAIVLGVAEALADRVEQEVAAVGAWPHPGAPETGELGWRGMSGLVGGLAAGGLLYEVMAPVPLLAAVGVYAVSALAALRMRNGVPVSPVARSARSRLAPLAPGTAPVTTVAAASTAASSAVVAVLVLFALDDLGLGAPAFGLLVAGMAVAAAVGGLVAPSIGGVLGLRGGLVAALLVAGAGHAGAGVTADPSRPFVAAAGLGVAAGGGMLASVLLRALLHVGAGRTVDAEGVRAFHTRVWAAIPVGALAGGLVSQLVGVAPLIVGIGAAWAVIAVAAAAVPATVRGNDRDHGSLGALRPGPSGRQ